MKRSVLGIFLLLTQVSVGQIVFNETFTNDTGGVSGDSISVHQSNHRFDSKQLTFTGTGLIRNTQQSIAADYLEASESFNIELDQSNTLFIDSIDAESNTYLFLSFGVRKGLNTENGSNLKISYSTSGKNGVFIPITWETLPTGTGTTGWYYRTSNTEIPNTITTLKFESLSNDWRLDDIVLKSGNPKLFLKGNHLKITQNNTTSETNLTDFGLITANYGAIKQPFVIENKGDSDLIISEIELSNTVDYLLETSLPITLKKDQSTPFYITCKPHSIGLKNNIVVIHSNDNSNPKYTFLIKGEGVNETICHVNHQIIGFQDFEATDSNNWNYTLEQNIGVAIKGGTYFGKSGLREATPLASDNLSLQVNNDKTILEFESINTSDYNNVSLHFNLGSYSTTAGNGADVEDFVSVFISKNGGETWQHQLQTAGYNNAKWSLQSGTAVATNSYNAPLLVQKPTSGGYKIQDGFSNVVITDLPSASNLKIKIEVLNDKENEIWSLDNFTLSGSKKEIKTWDNQSWNSGNASTENTILQINDDYDTATHGNLKGCTCFIAKEKTVTIDSDDYLMIHGDLNIEGYLYIRNNGSLLQINDQAVNTGFGNFRRFSTPMKQYDYTYWSSPVTTQILERFSTNGIYYEYSSENNGWLKATGKMKVGKGYIIRAPDYVDYTNGNVSFNGEFYGTPNNGTIQIPIKTSNSKWNLIGNPYPSMLDADLFLTHPDNFNTTEGTLYFWTHIKGVDLTSGKNSVDDYASYNLTGGVAAINGGAVPEGKIASGQSFFIKGINNTSLTCNNSMRKAEENSFFFRNKTTSKKSRLWLEMTNTDGAYKQILIGYILGATNQFDRSYDGKIKNSASVLQFYSLNENESLTIQGRQYPFQTNDIIPLGYTSEIATEYQIAIAKKEGDFKQKSIYLHDFETNIIHDLSQKPYVFTTEKGTFNNRFKLTYQLDESLNINKIEASKNSFKIISNDNHITIFSTEKQLYDITVFDILGNELHHVQTESTDIKLPLEKRNQMLIIQMNDVLNTGNYTVKVVH